MYIGNGQELNFKNNSSINKVSEENFAAFLNLNTSEPQLKTNGKCMLKLGNDKQEK